MMTATKRRRSFLRRPAVPRPSAACRIAVGPGAELSAREWSVVSLIYEAAADGVKCPTLRDMGERLDISKVTVFEVCKRLVRRGILSEGVRGSHLDYRIVLPAERAEKSERERAADLCRCREELRYTAESLTEWARRVKDANPLVAGQIRRRSAEIRGVLTSHGADEDEG